jgi:hypothetical protein
MLTNLKVTCYTAAVSVSIYFFLRKKWFKMLITHYYMLIKPYNTGLSQQDNQFKEGLVIYYLSGLLPLRIVSEHSD